MTAAGIGILVGKFSSAGVQGSFVCSVAMSLLLGPVVTLVGKPLGKILGGNDGEPGRENRE